MNKSWIANGFTAANALFGGLSIMMSISGEYHVAAICILFAMAADAFDGRVARALGTAGPMGVEPVSYTHLDVYKRQLFISTHRG